MTCSALVDQSVKEDFLWPTFQLGHSLGQGKATHRTAGESGSPCKEACKWLRKAAGTGEGSGWQGSGRGSDRPGRAAEERGLAYFECDGEQ
jgi:hypothetical protein